MAGCSCAEANTAALLIGVKLLPGYPFNSAWCLVCEVRRLTVDWVDCGCFLSFVFLGGARRLELSPCHTLAVSKLTDGNVNPGHMHFSASTNSYYLEPAGQTSG